jgi:hypothetical protein
MEFLVLIAFLFDLSRGESHWPVYLILLVFLLVRDMARLCDHVTKGQE